MKIAVTGGTGFIGRYILRRLVHAGHSCRCWYRSDSDRTGFDELSDSIEWVQGELIQPGAAEKLMQGCQAAVHNGLWSPTSRFQHGEGDLVEYGRVNILGSLDLMQTAIKLYLKKCVFVSTCAVHDQILSDRPLDESHPLWPRSHYGAHKAAIEKFVHSFGLGHGFPICAVRPSGVYGQAYPISNSKYYSLIKKIRQGEDVTVGGGGKEVHASDVAKAIEILLNSGNETTGQSYSCCDRYVSEYEVATIAKKATGSNSQILGEPKSPKNQIETSKIRNLGMEFGGQQLLTDTIRELAQT